jgi:5-methyltetrahydrofolate--homocysteine methyltransferase
MEVGVMLIIGERINSSRKNIASAMSTGDKAFLQEEVNVQYQSGADYINVNAAAFLGEEIEKLKWVIDVVQELNYPCASIVPIPYRLGPDRLQGILPFITAYRAKVIGL